MQIKKRFIITFFIFLTFDPNIFSGGGELWIYNNSSNDIWVHVYPVSMVFNNDTYGTNGRNYCLLGTSKVREGTGRIEKYFMNGINVTDLVFFKITPSQTSHAEWGFDGVGGTDELTKGTIGFGRWRVDFYESENINGNPADYCILEYDLGYVNLNRRICGEQPADVNLRFVNENTGHTRVQFLWETCKCMHNTPYQDIPENKYVLERDRGCQDQSWPPDKGNFRYNTGSPWEYTQLQRAPNNYDIIPQDPRRDCVTDIYPGILYDFKTHNHLFNYLYTINFIDYYGASDVGKLTLNLTIEKDVSTPDFLSWQFGMIDYPCVLPSPIVITDGARLTLEKGNNNNPRQFIFKQIEGETFGTHLKIEAGGTMDLQAAEISDEKAHVKFESYCNTEIEHNGVLRLKKNSLWEMTGNSEMIWYPNSAIVFSGSSINPNNYGKILLKGNSVLTNCGAYISGALNIILDGGFYRVINSCELPLGGGPFESVIDSGGCITVKSGAVFEIASGASMIFNGEETHLKLEPGSIVKLGSGASIEFRNGAYLDADGCTFTSINSGEIWNGIVLDGAGSQTDIRNCTFIDAAASIEVTNTVCSITGNTFNISNNTSCLYGINAVNETNITIAGNTFNAGSNSGAECLKFFNYDGDGLPGGGGVPVFYLNVFDNTFNGGVYAINIQCLTASQLPFYIAYNSFNPAMGITYAGIFAYNISGNIKNNTFYNSYSNKAVSLQFSGVNVYNNILHSAYQNIWSNNSTIMQMSPLENEYGQWVWYGGNNKLSSVNSYNIEFRTYSNPFISPNGNNCFTVNTQPNFLGELCLGTKPYSAYDNYWSPSVSGSTFDITCNSNPVNVTYTPNLTECPDIDPGDIIGSNISSIGGSLYDTVYITSSGGEGGSEEGNLNKTKKSANTDKILYHNAIQKRKQKNYADAINKCKELINNHDTSIYFNSALSELYLNYLNSDTTGNQTITNGLFSNLKTYIEQKMQQYQNNAQFIERAYKYLLMCLVKIKSYSEAVAGYENIMNNHPDPIVRLNASWDRSAVVFMMGQGGSEKEKSVNNSKSKDKKLLDKNPAHRIAKDIFKVQQEESERIETENELYGDNKSNKNKLIYTKEEKRIFESRIDNYNPVNEKEFIEKLSGDIKVMEQVNTAKTTNKVLTNIPKTYKLYQNYPNPFNPTTSIKYEIPKNAQVTIKVYDILGKEVFSLNEYKLAGSYEVKFDGSNLASGMYFYSLKAETSQLSSQSGRDVFTDTKKMVLLK